MAAAGADGAAELSAWPPALAEAAAEALNAVLADVAAVRAESLFAAAGAAAANDEDDSRGAPAPAPSSAATPPSPPPPAALILTPIFMAVLESPLAAAEDVSGDDVDADADADADADDADAALLAGNGDI